MMKHLSILISMLIVLTACSQESTPYEEINQTLPDSGQQGYIQTH